MVKMVYLFAESQFFYFYVSTKRVFFMFRILQRYLNYFGLFIFFYLVVFEPLKLKKKFTLKIIILFCSFDFIVKKADKKSILPGVMSHDS
jgi:hypothetical protein